MLAGWLGWGRNKEKNGERWDTNPGSRRQHRASHVGKGTCEGGPGGVGISDGWNGRDIHGWRDKGL